MAYIDRHTHTRNRNTRTMNMHKHTIHRYWYIHKHAHTYTFIYIYTIVTYVYRMPAYLHAYIRTYKDTDIHTIQYSTVQHNTTRHDATRHDTTQHSTTQCTAIKYDKIRFNMIQCWYMLICKHQVQPTCSLVVCLSACALQGSWDGGETWRGKTFGGGIGSCAKALCDAAWLCIAWTLGITGYHRATLLQDVE